MTDSQRHRPAASVSPSWNARMQKKLEDSLHLEQHESINKDDEKAMRVRTQLCESWSDILLTDPCISLEHDITGRLWRSCFYQPIGRFRSRIAREKKKSQHRNTLAKLEQAYGKCLQEAIALYDYLILQFHSKLIKATSQSPGTQVHHYIQESESESTHFTPPTATAATTAPTSTSPKKKTESCCVIVLFRLYIHMGDLFRYSQQFNKAEKYYVSASKLAPGMGNPYNQLAVVSQLKEPSFVCVALYWYIRSLFATHDSFQTSMGNLDRLWKSNRSQLKEHDRGPPPVLPNISSKKTTEMVRAQKTAASKSCMVHFCDLHYEFFLQQQPSRDIQRKADLLLSSIQSLLDAVAFGDSLLCKMVIINMFSAAKNSSSRDFFIGFGSCLAKRFFDVISSKRVYRGLLPLLLVCEFIHLNPNPTFCGDHNNFWEKLRDIANLIQKHDSNNGNDNIQQTDDSDAIPMADYEAFRGYKPLAPLFISSNNGVYISELQAVKMLELEDSMTPASTTDEAKSNNNTNNNKNSSNDASRLKRFKYLCDRFAESSEYLFFHKPDGGIIYDTTQQDEENVALQQVQEHQPKENGSSLLLQEHPLLPSQQTTATAANNDNVLSPATKSPVAFPYSLPPQEEDEAGDVVVYKPPQEGSGPALLVPGNLLPTTSVPSSNNNVETTASPSKPPLSSAFLALNNNEKPLSLAPPIPDPKPPLPTPASAPAPAIMPPPGFGIPVATPGPQLAPAPPVNVTPLPGNPLATSHMYHHEHQLPPFFGMENLTSNTINNNNINDFVNNSLPPYNSLPPPPPPQPPRTFGQDPEWLNGGPLFTANPFANHLQPQQRYHHQQQQHHHQPQTNPPFHLAAAEATTMEGNSLLDSGLLNSLFMDESTSASTTTKNPFAT